MPVKTSQQLYKFAFEIFEALGAPVRNAELVARLLVKANLVGHDSHGVIRIPSYVDSIRKKALNPKADIRIIRDNGATMRVDGRWGFGQVAAWRTMERTAGNAKKNGVCVSALFNCNHIGRLADYSAIPLKRSMIGFTTCNGAARVAPFNGAERMLNPGPLSVAIPSSEEGTVVLDISTSVVAEGKLMVRRKRHEGVPEGWIIDGDGRPTTDVEDYFRGGALLPLGGAVGYKGFGLGLIVDILGGALTGSGCSSSPEYKGGNGVIMGAVDVSRFAEPKAFVARVDELLRRIRSSRKAPGAKEILIPGELESREEARRLKDGIYVEDETWSELADLGKGLGLKVPN